MKFIKFHSLLTNKKKGSTEMEFRLPKLEDRKELLEYIEEHYSLNEKKLSASIGLTSMPFEEWIEKMNKNSKEPDKEWGKSLTYLAFDDERLIGLLSVRYELGEELAWKFGHIGYGVRPRERRKGYATQMLKFALEECKRYGLNKVIVGCYSQNIASAKTIIKNGGKLVKETSESVEINEFWKIKLTHQYYEIDI